MKLSHIDRSGRAVMVNVSAKEPVLRTATAAGSIAVSPETIRLIRKGTLKKGDAIACARLAGIMAAKKTAELIPLCHNLPLDHVAVDIEPSRDRISIRATAVCSGKTGVEMEALTAVSVAALTIYDMCKATDKAMRIEGIRLVTKTKEPLQ